MALNNCSINSQSFTKTGGDAIGSTNAQLVIVPDSGYVVSASDFTNNTGSIPGVSSITLSDSSTAGSIGNTVLVNIDLDDAYVMPSANTDIVIDIDGEADLISYTLNGTYSSIVSNASPSSQTNIVYNGTGSYNEQVTVLTKTFTADSGYYFEAAPNYILSQGEHNNYSITTTNTLDSENRIISTEFDVKYTFPNYNKSNDSILFTAIAEEYYVPTVEINSYSIITSNLDLSGGTRVMRVYGVPEAEFSLSVENKDSTSILSIVDQAIPSSGVYEFNVVFPSVTDSDQYDFILTGDLSSNFDTAFGQPSTFNVKQLANIDVSIGLTHTNPNITISQPISKNLVPGLELQDDDINFDNTFTISSSASNLLNILDSAVVLSEFTNTDGGSNGGTYMDIEGLTFSVVSDTEISAYLEANVYTTGDNDVTSTLNLDSYIDEENVAPVAQNVSISVSKGGTSSIILLLATDDNGDTLTYSVVTLPSVGTLYSDAGLANPITAPGTITGNTVYYQHDDSDNFDTLFTYKANDGSLDSNTANVNIAVGVSPGESVTASGDTGVFLIPIVLGTDPGTFKAHLDAQSVPDRFQILFDTEGLSNDIADMEVVADSLWVGDDVRDDTSPYKTPHDGTTTGLNLFTYNGSTWDETSTGTESYTITDADVAANTGIRTTANPNGVARNGAIGTQLGVQDLVYTSISDTTGTTGLNFADGNIALTYTKGSTTSYKAYIRIFGLPSTQWDLFQTEFIPPLT
jgi:hypothetical protein